MIAKYLSSVFLYFFLVTSVCVGADRITTNKPLSWNQTIVSTNNIFEVGFFQPGNSSNYYIGMWYKQVSERTILWVANRETPVSDLHASELKILDGNLVITTSSSRSSKPIWSTNLNFVANPDSIEAVLLDSGNFVLRNGPDSSHLIWQSADFPANVWIPGYKIGIDKRTKTNRVLTSWKNSNNPSLGLYTFRLELNGTIEFVIYWNHTERYWSSGAWDSSDQSFALLPQLRNKPKNSYHFSFVDNENETYFTYYVHSHAIPSIFAMDVSGQLKSLVWPLNTQKGLLLLSLPDQQCEVYRYCGAFGICSQKSMPYCNCLHGFRPKTIENWKVNDYSSGCSRLMEVQCMNSSNSRKKMDKFWASYNMGLPEHAQTVIVRNMEDCELACQNNCSCTAYAYSSDGCSIWIGDLLNVKQLPDGDPNGKTIYIRLNALEFQTSNDKKRVIGIITGSVVALIVLSGLVSYTMIIWGRKRLLVRPATLDGSLVQFRYKQLQRATKNFSEKLGGGGFGSVFKGRFKDASLIAVKVLQGASQGEKQFRAEVSTLGNVQHVNLVRLRGFCSEGTKRLLVYEYMPNGSLDTHLFPGKKSTLLNWRTRYQIAVGTAKGLAYLHENCKDCIIHCDIKPENILLDDEFSPKIADFGLAKLFGREFSRVITTMRGTRGYLAPEWISGAAITAKADVYSYGMMLFEFISGRRNTEQVGDNELDFFPSWAVRKMCNGEDIISILDHRLEGNAESEQVLKMCKLACWCIQEDEDQRPTMGKVIQILEGFLDVSMLPMPRSLHILDNNHSQINFFVDNLMSEPSSYASVTSSMYESSSYVSARSQV
ncbi:hypothetical protein BVRB_6g139100 [Beta vulgaris subsp. vulgaris]|nr:hypothetical protein BVRB_6g139100 [Beta vulgaris subsp. vulgaris]